MSPRTIVQAAISAGMNLVALTDHNSARNVPAFAAACAERGLAALYGCEVTSVEEVHVLALFSDPDAAVEFGDGIYAALPAVERGAERFGDQVVVDVDETVVDTLTSYLIAATPFAMDEIGLRIHAAGGLYIPAHIDRAAFSVWSQLGFLPADAYDAVEVIGAGGRIDAEAYPRVCSSDAHEPQSVGRRWIEFDAIAPGFDALLRALRSGRVTLSIDA